MLLYLKQFNASHLFRSTNKLALCVVSPVTIIICKRVCIVNIKYKTKLKKYKLN